jgi:hypothetical protein
MEKKSRASGKKIADRTYRTIPGAIKIVCKKHALQGILLKHLRPSTIAKV